MTSVGNIGLGDSSGEFIDGPQNPQDDASDCDEILVPPEPSAAMRTFYRMLMGLIPAIGAVFLEQSIISVISTAAGFLAPPFVIIFPALMSLKLRDEGKLPMSNCLSKTLWVFLIFFGVGSYIAVILNVVYGSGGAV